MLHDDGKIKVKIKNHTSLVDFYMLDSLSYAIVNLETFRLITNKYCGIVLKYGKEDTSLFTSIKIY